MVASAEGPDLRAVPEEFSDWIAQVPTSTGTCDILCCPEDQKCDTSHAEDTCVFCERCEVPLCSECKIGFKDETGAWTLPDAALANDMMIFYAPRELYDLQVTVRWVRGGRWVGSGKCEVGSEKWEVGGGKAKSEC